MPNHINFWQPHAATKGERNISALRAIKSRFSAGAVVDEPEIALMYTASSEYEMDNLTATAFLDLIHRWKKRDHNFPSCSVFSSPVTVFDVRSSNSRQFELATQEFLCFYRMEDGDEIFDRYYANKRMRMDTSDCSGDCKTNELCGLTSTTPQTYLACLLHTMGVDTDTNQSENYGAAFAAAPNHRIPMSFVFLFALAILNLS